MPRRTDIATMLSIVIVVLVNAKLDQRKPIDCLGNRLAVRLVASYKDVVNGKASKHFGTSLFASAYLQELIGRLWQPAADSHSTNKALKSEVQSFLMPHPLLRQ